ncbi:MAG: efflux RND transporter periplasmic adaptor subunit [Filomicrobium sp.]
MFRNEVPQYRHSHSRRTDPVFRRFVLLCCLPVLIAACERPDAGEGNEAQYPPAPVTIYKLVERDFTRDARLTGSVGLYRQEDVGFEVGGRLLFVLDLGKEVEGPAYDEAGQLVRQGEVVAKIDDTRYRLKFQALEARLRALRKDLEAQRIDVDQVAEANLKAAQARLRISASDIAVAERQVAEAEAEVTRTRLDYNRQKDLKQRASSAFREKTLDDAKAAYDTAAARKEQREALLDARARARDAQSAVVTVAEATILFKKAKVESTSASIAELEQELTRAREDLEDAVLYAPFSSRVTKIHASQGAVVEAGKPIVTLTLMDPVQVRVAVSANTERRIRTGDRAWVFPRDPTDPEREATKINALVFETGSVADPDTRTFRIDLIARNRRRLIQDVDPETKGLPVVTDFLPVARRFEGESGPLFVPTQSIYREEGKTYVFRLPGISFHDGPHRNAIGKHTPQKIEVGLGDGYFTVIKWNFRSLVESSDLREGDFLVIGPIKEHLDGLAIDQPQWLLRPGDLVPVRFVLNTTPKGFYVPVNAIAKIDGRHIVYLVVDDKAEPVPVTVHETYGEYRRVAGNRLNIGSAVIVSGIHLVSNGQPVSVVRQLTNLSDGAPIQ